MVCARVAEYLKNNYHENAILSHLLGFLTCLNLFVALSVRRRMQLVIIRKPRESRTSDYSLELLIIPFYPLFILAVLKALGT